MSSPQRYAEQQEWAEQDRLEAIKWLEASNADDLRALGWSIAVHNDYRQNGESYTFWLLTKGDRCVKGEGSTAADALNQIRKALLVAAEAEEGAKPGTAAARHE